MVSFSFSFDTVGDEKLQGLRVTAFVIAVVALIAVMHAIAVSDIIHPRSIFKIEVLASGPIHLKSIDIEKNS